ncbi:uncharacterized protein EDB91DRAFT_1249614 [Suillus paluster]|uniref:uncharacterized protein n=1 Tax=Suillus paluster TaxID=48578 RepID=UPI001B861474|nr:uncharacterized protein EDB91DRAFT_1249614 [Suillus paluster]KAG1737483.1 hypothetical protein EDB91DRAFT_1249614 [Suillus paluster]
MGRGPRGAESCARQYNRWGKVRDMDKIKEAIERDLHKSFPADFITLRASGEDVREMSNCSSSPLEANYSSLWTISPYDSVPPEIPPYLIMRLEHFLTDDQQGGLLAQWDRFIASCEALHLGVWEVTAKKPRLTLESRDQSDEAVEAMDDLLCFIKTYIAPKIGTAFKEHAPVQWDCILKANDRVLKLLKCDLKLRPSLFMGGPFFAVAAKEAGSGIMHLDWNDDKVIYAFASKFPSALGRYWLYLLVCLLISAHQLQVVVE